MLSIGNSGLAQSNIDAPYNDTTALEMPEIDTISADSAEYRKFRKATLTSIVNLVETGPRPTSVLGSMVIVECLMNFLLGVRNQ